MSQEISFIRARIDDAGRIVALVNRAYRGDSSRSGWTNEADLFDGPRTDESEVRDLIASDGSMILVCVQGTDIVGSVLLKKSESTAYLGMLVTDPLVQGAGIGSRLMQAAEAVAREQWAATRISITVITCRDELVAFYQRRGYRRTGRIAPVPPDDLSTQPLLLAVKVPADRGSDAEAPLDLGGALLAVLALGLLSYGLIALGEGAYWIGAIALAAAGPGIWLFLHTEARSAAPIGHSAHRRPAGAPWRGALLGAAPLRWRGTPCLIAAQ